MFQFTRRLLATAAISITLTQPSSADVVHPDIEPLRDCPEIPGIPFPSGVTLVEHYAPSTLDKSCFNSVVRDTINRAEGPSDPIFAELLSEAVRRISVDDELLAAPASLGQSKKMARRHRGFDQLINFLYSDYSEAGSWRDDPVLQSYIGHSIDWVRMAITVVRHNHGRDLVTQELVTYGQPKGYPERELLRLLSKHPNALSIDQVLASYNSGDSRTIRAATRFLTKRNRMQDIDVLRIWITEHPDMQDESLTSVVDALENYKKAPRAGLAAISALAEIKSDESLDALKALQQDLDHPVGHELVSMALAFRGDEAGRDVVEQLALSDSKRMQKWAKSIRKKNGW